MGNQFNLDLTNRFVILKDDYIYIDFPRSKKTIKGSDVQRVFRCNGGYGCKTNTAGTLIAGFIVSNGFKLGIRGYDYMERLATNEEINEAKKLAEKNSINIEELL